MTGGEISVRRPVAAPLQPRLVAGGSEGLAMLNRTNRKLSAKLNRLNLGTRSFVLATGELNGKSILRFRHAHAAAAMRAGLAWSLDPSIRPMSRISIPSYPGSSVVVPRSPVRVSVVRPSVGDSDAPPALTDRLALAACLIAAGPGQPEAPSPAEGATFERKPLQGKRSGSGKAFAGTGIFAERWPAVATFAPAGG